MNFPNLFNAAPHRALPVSTNPTMPNSIATKTVAIRIGVRNEICDHARSRFVSGALFYGRAYRGTSASAGFASLSGTPTRYSPTTKNPFDRRAFVGGLN